ncbi:hypothetical protein ACWEQ0_19750 [Nocardia thailandica]
MTEFEDNRFDAVERLRRKWEAIKAAEQDSGTPETGPSNVVRLPRPPRRVGGEAAGPGARPGPPDAVVDPAPTRPVTRAELQAETGTWQADEATPPADPPPARENKVLDFDPSRRKRAGGEGARGGRPRIAPRRVGSGEKERGGDTDPTPPDRTGR